MAVSSGQNGESAAAEQPAPMTFRRLPWHLSGALVLLSLLAACAVPDAGSVPAGATRSIDLQAQARSFIATVQAVEPVAEAECRDRAPGANCDFRILVDDRPGMPPNAFQTVDEAGRPVIAFTLALIAEVGNADELAFVMSHEAAHHILGHLDRQSHNAAVGAAALGQLAAVLGTTDAGALRQAQELGAAFGARSYSKAFELEADALGTVISLQAGFDPLQGAAFFMRIPDPGNRFLGTHPPNADRIAVVRQTVAAAGG